MFWNLFKKKQKIDIEKVKEFNEAKKAINFFIVVEEWENAYKAIEEIKEKEFRAYEKLIKNIDREISSWLWKVELTIKEREKAKQHKIYEDKINDLDNLKKVCQKKEKIIFEKLENERFKVRFKKIKDEVNLLVKTNKNTEALNLLSKFLEEKKEDNRVIKFYNSQKRYITKNIEAQRKREEAQLRKDAKLEALSLIWEKTNKNKGEEIKEEEKKSVFFKKIKDSLDIYKNIKERLRKKRLLDEVSILIEEDSKAKKDIAEKKLENIHKWLIKELNNNNIIWYDLYWKILWADKISWDTFWFNETKEKYDFFLWDATWHWIRAWFIVTLISRIFSKYVNKLPLRELCFEINNWLKQDLKNRNFITWIFFEIFKDDLNKIHYLWMWHEPILIFRNKTNTVEKIIAGWLAAWIRNIKDINTIKIKETEVEDSDIIMVYSDWVVETKSPNWEFYSINRLAETFNKIAKMDTNLTRIYNYIIKDLKIFKSWTSFSDDTTILFFKRNTQKDVVDESSDYLKDLSINEWLNKTEIKKLEWKTKDEIKEELEKIRKEKEIKNIVKNLENLYYTWEILKLKQEAIRFIKAWYIDSKINFYLKKAMDNETKYKVEQKNKRMQNKYNVIKELYDKWDYKTVIREAEEVIWKDWRFD